MVYKSRQIDRRPMGIFGQLRQYLKPSFLNYTAIKKIFLEFMASNGFVANASKTSMIILNLREKKGEEAAPLTIKIGKDTIKQEKTAKLLALLSMANKTGPPISKEKGV